MTDRESRIRALAGVIADARWDGLYMQSSHTLDAQGCLERAARIIDALDALPVPGEAKVCEVCLGSKHRIAGRTRVDCDACNGTGKAER